MYILALLIAFLAVCALAVVAIFRKKRCKLELDSWLAKFSFEADDDPPSDPCVIVEISKSPPEAALPASLSSLATSPSPSPCATRVDGSTS